MKKSRQSHKGGLSLKRTERNYEQKTEMSKWSELRNCCTITKFRFCLSRNNYEFSGGTTENFENPCCTEYEKVHSYFDVRYTFSR